MKNSKVYVAIACSSLGVAGISYGLNQTLNFESVNQNLQSALDEVVGRSDVADDFKVKLIEERTELEQNKYAASFSMRLKNASWTEQVLPINGEIRFEAAEAEGLNRMFFDLNFETEAVSLTKQLSKMHECPVADSVVGVDRIHLENHCAMAEQLKNVATVAEVRSVTENSVSRFEQNLIAYKNELNSSLPLLTGQVEINKLLQGQLSLTERYVETVGGIQFQDLQGGFQMTMPTLRYSEKLTLESYSVTVQPELVRTTIEVSSPLGKLMHEATKPEIERFLTAMEQNRDFAREMVQMDARVILRLWELANSAEE